jgi:NAD(P)-dependent dehydrogenase (short-subunit alcohol dehydrogenase family)
MGQDVLSWKMRKVGASPQDILAATAAGIPLQRNATTEDVVNAVMFFLAEGSSFLTGVALDVDGGLLSTMPLPGGAK